MGKPISKAIKKVSENVGSNKVVIITNHLKVDGSLYIEDGKCDECHDDIITLTDVTVCRLNDYCTCEGEDCNCSDYVCFKYDWINITVYSIVAYSIIA
jgi:hypothetical protein